LWGECLSGALYWNDFVNMAIKAGFQDPRLVEDAPITIENPAVAALVSETGNGALKFYSATYRLFKMDELEPACEDYGQAVVYKGTIPMAASGWMLDKGHVFETGKIHPVCGNSWNMLHGSSRLNEHFDFIGNFDKHYGNFEGCGTTMPYDMNVQDQGKGKGSDAMGAGCC
jgi:arsenite methyltransferase